MTLEELIRACVEDGSVAVWQEFVHRFHIVIGSTVFRTAQRWGATSPALVDDLIQESYLKLCSDRKRLLREFQPQAPDSFYGYLKVVTANVVHDYFRTLHTRKRGKGQTDEPIDSLSESEPVAKIGTPLAIERELLLQEIDLILKNNLSNVDKVRDRTIFWLYYRQGFSAEAIARMPSISLTVKGVESVIYRLTSLVRKHLSNAPPEGNKEVISTKETLAQKPF